jgi:hypothetical protein
MANLTTSNPTTDDTSLLLGWECSGRGNGAAVAALDDEQWSSLHFRVRSTAEGLEAFKRALRVLSGDNGRIVFNAGDYSEKGSSARDPRLVVDAYFRLLRCTLEPADSPDVMNESEWIQFTKGLLKNLGESLKSSIKQQIDLLKEGPDSLHGQSNRSNNTRRNSTILHYFRSMINHVVRYKTSLGQTYKIFSEVAELFATLLQSESMKIAELVTKFLPVVGIPALSSLEQDVDQLNNIWEHFNGCLKDGTLCLIESMHEGLQTLQRALSGQQQLASKPDSFSKITVFMMARTIKLIFLRRRRTQQGKLNLSAMLHPEIKSSVDESDDGESSLISQCLLILIKIRSLSVLANGCLEDVATMDRLDDGRLKLFEMLTGLGLRVDVYAGNLLCLKDPCAQSDNTRVRVGMRCLADLPSEEFNVSMSVTGIEGEAILTENCLPLGKLFVMKHVLKTLCQPSSDLSLGDVSPILVRLCESMIFTDLPSIHHFFRLQSPCGFELPTWASEFISDVVIVLESFTRVLFVSNSKETSRQTQIRQHQQIMRWLAGTHNNSSSSRHRFRSNHPFSNEIIVCILQARMIISTASSQTIQDAHDLISLMAKLVFHQQTETSHRRRIVTVFARLLRASNRESIDTKAIAVKNMWNELKRSTAFNSMEISLCKRKRKTPSLALLDGWEICWALETLIDATLSMHMGVDDTIRHEMRLIWEIILRSSESNNKITQQGPFSDKQIFATSLFIGAMKCLPNIGSIQHIFDGQDRVKSVQSIAFIDGSLAFIDSLLVPESRKSNRTRHHHICIRYIGALIALLGREFTESNLHRTGVILKNINSERSTSRAEGVYVRNILISTASKFGPVIQPSFAEKSLKVKLCFFLFVLQISIYCSPDLYVLIKSFFMSFSHWLI